MGRDHVAVNVDAHRRQGWMGVRPMSCPLLQHVREDPWCWPGSAAGAGGASTRSE